MITVNGRAWDILYVKPNNPLLKNSDGVYTLGVTDGLRNTVYINNQLKGRMLDKVLCHELSHVFCFSYGVMVSRETEELMADFLATYGRDIIYVADSILSRFAHVC